MIDLESVASSATAQHDATETVIGEGPATVIHDQAIASGEARLAADLGLTEWLAVGGIVPVRLFQTSITYLENGKPVEIENPYIHHHDETLVGPGDPWLYGRIGHRVGSFTLGGRLGVTIPLGRTEPDPFALGDMGIAHEHSQFGTGSLGVVAGVEAARTFDRGKVTVDISALTIQSIYENKHGYLAGDRYALTIGATSSFGTKHWSFRSTISSIVELAEKWQGVEHSDDGNSGRIDVLAGLSASYLFGEHWHVGLDLKVPAYTHVVGGQFDMAGFIGVSIGTTIHLFGEDEDEHDHDHGDEKPADWTGLDKRDVAATEPREGLPGKITVYDFWATWCEPCGDLDRELATLARTHDDLAVRKIDVGAETELTLPFIEVYGRDGKLLWKKHASVKSLAAGVEEALSGPRMKQVVPANAPRVSIDVIDAGFSPELVEIEHGRPTVLVLTRKSDQTCAVDIHFEVEGTKIDEDLPLNTPVEIVVAPKNPGRIEYSCGMNMNHGTIVVK